MGRKFSDDSDDEDTDGYSEGADDLSSGFELPPMPDFKKSEDSARNRFYECSVSAETFLHNFSKIELKTKT
jgi:hypothetical protein